MMKPYWSFSMAALLVALAVFSAAARAQQVPAPPPPAITAVPPVPAMPALAPHVTTGGGQDAFMYRVGQVWLGVRLEDVTAERARDLKLPGDYGAIVASVEPDSPAAKAGLEPNDVIVKFAGERVWSAAQLARWVRETPAGRTANLTVYRNGKPREAEVTIARRESLYRFNGGSFSMPSIKIPPINIPQFDIRIFSHNGVLGISGEDLPSQLATYFGVKDGKGVLVREVFADSAAAKAGLKAGDVIVKLNSQPVNSVMELRRALESLPENAHQATVTIVRSRREQTLTVAIAPPSQERTGTADMVEMLGVSPEELSKLASESQDYATQAQVMAQEIQREAREQVLRNQSKWEAEMKQAREAMRDAQKKLQEQLKKEVILRDQLAKETII